MKKSNIVIISVCALILLLSGIFALRYIKTQKSGPSAVNGDFTESAQKQRAKKLPTAVRAVEDEDFSLSGGFAEQNEAGEDSLAFLSSSCFDSVFVKTKAFSASKSGSLSAKKQKALKSFLKKLKPKIAIVTNYLGKIYPNVKWNLTVVAKVPIYSCVNRNGIIAAFTDDGRIVLTENIM